MSALLSCLMATFTVVLGISCAGAQSLTCNRRDLKALQDFFRGLDQWRGVESSSSSNCCNWTGVVCSADSGRVVQLDLPRRGLAGRLTESIGELDRLTTLNLSVNSLRGPLPISLFRYSDLQTLDLSSNTFSGAIPQEMNSPSLKLLDLSQNLLTGSIPDVFPRLPKLQYFAASSNSLHGGLSPSLLDSSTLQTIILRQNSLTAPLILNCPPITNLSLLDLGTNHFYGPIPGGIASCRKLQSINLSGNNLSGDIPESLRELQNLSFLSISNASLHNVSAALRALQHCKSLTSLILTLNFHGGELLPSDPDLRFSNMKVLVIANCKLTGSIPPWLRTSDQLELLDLSWNQLTGSIPPWLGDFISLFYIDLSNNSLTGKIPVSLTQLRELATGDIVIENSFTGIPLFRKQNTSARGLQYNRVTSFPSTVALSHNHLSGHIWPEFGKLKDLHILDLKFNNLSGSIPRDLASMASLEKLDLSHNNLSGTIPLSLSNLTFLSTFSVAYNRLSGEVPSGGQFLTFPSSSFEGNNYLCSNRSPPPCQQPDRVSSSIKPNPSRTTTTKKKILLTAGISSAAILLSLLIISFVSIRSLQRNGNNVGKEGGGDDDPAGPGLVVLFRKEDSSSKELLVDDLLQATNNFDEANIIGCGGFGLVYKAALPDGRKVAIKRLSGECLQLEREFQAEVETLSRAQHRNLVLLQGYCRYNSDRLLMYTYMENGSLDYWLHEKSDGPTLLDWERRFRIARGATEGLAYLHQSCEPHIVHRDIKSSNILLDENFEARLADFGLARLIPPYHTHVTTDLVGTLGYIPPEYGQASEATFEGDVYSLGVVLLELVTGRRPVDICRPAGAREMIAWVTEMKAEKRETEVVDPLIYEKTHRSEILKVLSIACLCVNQLPKRRPSVQHLLSWLDRSTMEI